MRNTITRTLALVILLAAAAHAETVFHTENWTSGWESRWNVLAGTPYTPISALYNSNSDLYTRTRLLYAAGAPGPDHSVSTALSCDQTVEGYNPGFFHYLRANGNNYYLIEAWYYVGSQNVSIVVYRAGSAPALLGQTGGIACGTLKSSVSGSASSTITVSMNGTTVLSLVDSSSNRLTSGNLGVGTVACKWGFGTALSTTTLAVVDTEPPSVPTGLTAAAYNTRVNLSWTASTDNVVVKGYKVFKNGTYIATVTGWLGQPPAPTTYSDLNVNPATPYTYTVLAYDSALNESAQSAPLALTTPPTSISPPEAGGPVEYASTWGAGPERIALLTGALGIRIPLPKLQHRSRGPGFHMLASWNSQFWTWDAAGTKMSAIDTGYGLGWNFMVGAMYPVYESNNIVRFEFIDAGGVIHKLFETGTNTKKYKSKDSTYLLWDFNPSPPTLTFTDGTVWSFNCYSRYPEADAGTYYPTKLLDTNGNRIDINYQPASGMTGNNSSSRIVTIQDTMAVYTWQYTTINGQPQTRVLLKEINFTGAPNPFKFEYNASGEVTKITVPHKGYFRYVYGEYSFSNGARKTREVTERWLAADGAAASEKGWCFQHPAGDQSLPNHSETWLCHPDGNVEISYFLQNSPNGWDNGLEYIHHTYQGAALPANLARRIEKTWTQDNPAPQQPLSNPRIFSVITKLKDGVTQSKVERDVDANGNVTYVREYGYGNGAPGPLYRQTETLYLSTPAYVARNILNRPTQVAVCANPCPPFSAAITTLTYDNTSLIDVPGITQYETPPGVRGNVTSVNNNGIVVNHNYDIGGNLRSSVDASGHTPASATYQPTTGLVDTATSGGSTSTFGWNSNATLGSVTGSNSDTVSFLYTSYRPTRVNRPDNSYTTITYSDTTNPLTQTETRYLDNQTNTVAGVTTTSFDGFGRVIKVARKENDTTWVFTETQYAPCACGPMGKAVKTSRPYRTGQTPVWTETQYDALGRPTKIIYPDANETNYAYTIENNANWIGTLTLVTDPAGKKKRYLHDVFGRLLRVDEPDAAGTLTETARYSYDVMGRLTTVQMGRQTPAVSNNSFENGLTGWGAWGTIGPLMQSSVQKLVGASSLYYTSSGENGGAWRDISGLVAGQTYRIRAWVRGVAGNQLSAGLVLWDGIDPVLAVPRTDIANPSPDTWTLMEVEWTFGSTAMRIHLQANGTGALYWDWVTVTAVSSGINPKQTRTFVYNTKGQLLTATNPENGTVTYTYQADGLVESKRDAKNQTLWFFYDVKHRLLRIESPQGTVKTTFTYDTANGIPTTNANGRMTSAKNDGYTWHFGYDIMGRVVKQTMQAPNPVSPGYWLYAQAQYVFDGDGRLKDLYYPAGMVGGGTIPTGARYQYSYDLLGRATALQVQNEDLSWTTRVQGVQYNAAGQLTQWQECAGAPCSNLTRSYNDLRGWVTRITAKKNWPIANETVLDLDYNNGYLANGRVRAVNDVVNPGQSVTSYEYDELNRLTKAEANNWTLQWTYDEFGNRLTQAKVPGSSGTPPEIALSYNETTNRITTAGYTFDLNGNLTTMPSVNGNPALTTTWDVFDRAATITMSTKSFQMKSDAFGRRVERYDTSTGDAWNGRRLYFWGMDGRLLVEYNSGPQYPIAQVYFAGQRFGKWTDRTGSVRYAGGWKHYYPFGEEITGTTNDVYKFAATYRDADTTLDYATYRYYASAVARYLTPDPLPRQTPTNVPSEWNRYSYTVGDPVNNNDPMGLSHTITPEDQCFFCFNSAIFLGIDMRYICFACSPDAGWNLQRRDHNDPTGGHGAGGRGAARQVRMRSEAGAALNGMVQRCKDEYERIFGFGILEDMRANVDQTEYYDTRDPSIAGMQINAFGAHIPANPTLAQYLGSSYAAVIPGPGGPTNNIILGSVFFQSDFNQRAIVLSHELLHITTRLTDAQLATKLANAYGVAPPPDADASLFLGKWQENGCESLGPS